MDKVQSHLSSNPSSIAQAAVVAALKGPQSDQLRMVQAAGASIYGPAVNINTGKSTAWNIARAITFIKPAMEIAEIPVHVNVGMGVGGVPTCLFPPADATSRASKAFVEILKIDGY